MRGEVEVERHVLVIRRIHVKYHVVTQREAATVIDRVHRVHARNCPIYVSIINSIEITTEYCLIDPS